MYVFLIYNRISILEIVVHPQIATSLTSGNVDWQPEVERISAIQQYFHSVPHFGDFDVSSTELDIDAEEYVFNESYKMDQNCFHHGR